MSKVDLIISARGFEDKIIRVLESRVGKIFIGAAPRIKSSITSLIYAKLITDPTIISIQRGQLKRDFGLGSNSEKLGDKIAEEVSEAVLIRLVKTPGLGSVVGLSIDIQPRDLTNVMEIPGGSYSSKGGLVEWLHWLLFQGTTVIIPNFIALDNLKFAPYSRSGITLMIKKKGGAFRVDPKHAGIREDNFISRAIIDLSSNIVNIVFSEISRSL